MLSSASLMAPKNSAADCSHVGRAAARWRAASPSRLRSGSSLATGVAALRPVGVVAGGPNDREQAGEVVEDGVTGLLVEPGDGDALRDALDELLRDRALAARLGRSARDRALERFTWDACAARCLAAYQEIVGAGQRTGPR